MSVDVIVEIGINHDGRFEKAIRMINAAKEAGAKIVKFQHYDAEKLLGTRSPYYEYASQCQFTKSEHEKLKQFCDFQGIEYLVSVFDIKDIPWADSLCKRHKVASRMNKDYTFVEKLCETGREVIMSVNSDTTEYPSDKKGCVEVRPLTYGTPCYHKLRLMYCITKYPTLLDDLKALPCSSSMGLSSHCPDIRPTIDAIDQGATVVEQHVCFDRAESGCDKPASITFEELKQLIDYASKR